MRPDGLNGLTTLLGRGAGYTEVVEGKSAAGGTDSVLTMAGGVVSRLVRVRFRLTASAAVANRFGFVICSRPSQFGTAAGQFAFSGAAQAVTAGQSFDFDGSPNQGRTEVVGTFLILFPLTPTLLLPGDQVTISGNQQDAGDVIDRIALTFERFPDIDIRTGDRPAG